MAGTEINITDKAQARVLEALTGKSISNLYSLQTRGAFAFDDGKPFTEHSYIECIQALTTYFSKNAEAKAIKAEEMKGIALIKAEAGGGKPEKLGRPVAGIQADGEMHPLVAAKTIQDIRVNVARETQIWVKTAIERGEYVSLPRLQELIEPFVLTIRQRLLELGTIEECQQPVDEMMESLYDLGVKLSEGAVRDEKEFVKAILAKDIDVEEIGLNEAKATLL